MQADRIAVPASGIQPFITTRETTMPYPAEIVAEVRTKIVKRLKAGTLPRESPSKTWTGRGQRLNCTACDEPILPSNVEFDFDTPDGRQFRMHLGCAALWEHERQRR